MLKIPRVFHQIWLGGQMPEKFLIFQETWKNLHPNWKLILWNEKNINTLKYLEPSLLEECSNFSEKSDYLRFCILLEHGGVYIDTDFECLKNIEALINNIEFFIGYDGFTGDPEGCYCNSALFGSAKEHPLVEKIFNTFEARILSFKHLNSIQKIGPGYITPIIESYTGSIKIFPREIFYPIHWREYNSYVIIDRDALKKEGYSYGIHHYTFSWAPHWKKELLKFKIISFLYKKVKVYKRKIVQKFSKILFNRGLFFINKN